MSSTYPDDPDLEELILNDPLMMRELARQRADLQVLAGTPVLAESDIQALKGAGTSNLE